MIEGLKPYPAYKASGLPWTDLVPRHWGLLPNRALVRKRKVLVGKQHHNYRLLSLTKQGVIVRDVASGKGKFSSDMGTSQEVRVGDLVFCLFDVPETPRTVGISAHAGMITGAYTVFESISPKTGGYFDLFYRAMDDRKLLSPLYSGLRNTIPPGRFLGTKTPQPPFEEQAVIVRFLDHANRRIDRSIRAKRKLIALLNEQKQAVIHRAVTGGLEPNVAVLERGQFLGRIPTQWTMLRAKLLFQQVVPPIPEHAEQVTCFRDGQVTLRRNRRTTGFTNAIWELGYQGIAPGQLVLHSMDAFAGAIGVSDSAGKCSPEYVICEPAIEGVFPPFYASLLRSLALRGLFVALCPSVRERAPRIRFSHFGDFALPKPPIAEQKAIVEHILGSCRGIDASLSTVRREISLTQEYRTRLVADVVTGQLDVREAAARLPDEEPEAEGEEVASGTNKEEDGEPEEMAE